MFLFDINLNIENKKVRGSNFTRCMLKKKSYKLKIIRDIYNNKSSFKPHIGYIHWCLYGLIKFQFCTWIPKSITRKIIGFLLDLSSSIILFFQNLMLNMINFCSCEINFHCVLFLVGFVWHWCISFKTRIGCWPFMFWFLLHTFKCYYIIIMFKFYFFIPILKCLCSS